MITIEMMMIIVVLLIYIIQQTCNCSPIDIVQECTLSNSCNLSDFPVYVRLGFAAKVLEFIKQGQYYVNNRNTIGAQQLLAFKLAINYCNTLAMTDASIGDIDGDGKLGDVYVHPVVYKGEQLFNFMYYDREPNNYFDGSFGGYFLNLISTSLSGVIAAQDDDDTVESMMNTFKGWKLPTFIAKSQSTTFSHASKYPYKARIVPADNFQTIILHDVLRSYSWKRVAIFYTDDTDGIDCYNNFRRSASDYNVEILYVAHAVAFGSVDSSKQINDAISNGVTILLLFMRNKQQSLLLQQSFTLGLLTDRTQVIGCTFSNDPASVDSYLTSNVNDIMRGYLSIKWEDRAQFQTQSGKNFIQMFKTGTLNGVSLMNYTHGFQDPTYNFAKDGSNNRWYSNCRQWVQGTVNGNSIYGPNIQDLDVGNQANNYCTTGNTCGGNTGKSSTVCNNNNNCPSYVPPNTCELKYLKLCEDFDANMNPLWVTNCDDTGPLCGVSEYPADKLVDALGNDIYGIPLDSGMCLGLSRSDLDSIPNDGSSGIDPSTVFIFDAVVLNFKTAILFIKQNYQSAGGLPITSTDQTDWNNQVNSGLAYLFDNLISSMRDSGKKVTDTLEGLFTGDIRMDVGYVSEDNFMAGDRVTGFVYSLNNWDEKSQTLQASGFYDPNTKSFTSCSDSGSLNILGVPFHCTQPRYRGSAVPSDMQPPVYIRMSKEMKSALYVFGILLLLATTLWSVLMALNWNHKSLKVRQKYVLVFILLALFLGSFKVIISATWSMTEEYCGADYWLGHLAFRFMVLPIAYKLWRVDKLFNNATLKRIKVTETQVIHRILFFSSILIVVLIFQTGLAGPKIMTRSYIKNNQINITPFCGLGSYDLYSGAGRALNYLIFANQIFILALALWYTFRTLNVPPMVNEAAQISPSLVLMTIASAMAYAILVAYDVDPIIRSFVIDMLFGVGGIFGSALYFVVVFYQIYKPDKKTPKSKETIDNDSHNTSTSTSIVKSAIIPIDENLDDLAYNVSQALLRRAKGNEYKAMVCQNQIQFWRGQMLKIADQDEYSSKQSSGSVYVTDDDNYQDSSSIYSNDDNTATATTITNDRMNP